MVVNQAESVKEETVQNWVADKLKMKTDNERDKDFYGRAGIVHRLDKETSGVLLVAKTPDAFEKLQRQFKERTVKKHYLALVHGKVEPAQGEITAPVGRLPWNREKFGVIPGGREAKTKYKVLSVMHKLFGKRGETVSLLELYPETGRTHQIRIHLKYLGHPVVGDLTYAGRKMARWDRSWCPRLFLHASFLGFTHPESGEWLEFKSELPGDLQKVLSQI